MSNLNKKGDLGDAPMKTSFKNDMFNIKFKPLIENRKIWLDGDMNELKKEIETHKQRCNDMYKDYKRMEQNYWILQ